MPCISCAMRRQSCRSSSREACGPRLSANSKVARMPAIGVRSSWAMLAMVVRSRAKAASSPAIRVLRRSSTTCISSGTAVAGMRKASCPGSMAAMRSEMRVIGPSTAWRSHSETSAESAVATSHSAASTPARRRRSRCAALASTAVITMTSRRSPGGWSRSGGGGSSHGGSSRGLAARVRLRTTRSQRPSPAAKSMGWSSAAPAAKAALSAAPSARDGLRPTSRPEARSISCAYMVPVPAANSGGLWRGGRSSPRAPPGGGRGGRGSPGGGPCSPSGPGPCPGPGSGPGGRARGGWTRVRWRTSRPWSSAW